MFANYTATSLFKTVRIVFKYIWLQDNYCTHINVYTTASILVFWINCQVTEVLPGWFTFEAAVDLWSLHKAPQTNGCNCIQTYPSLYLQNITQTCGLAMNKNSVCSFSNLMAAILEAIFDYTLKNNGSRSMWFMFMKYCSSIIYEKYPTR